MKLGCSGETSGGMLTGNGGIDPPRGCGPKDVYQQTYPNGGNQVAEAVHLINEHPDKIRAVTINVGANDVIGCLYPTYVPDCFDRRVKMLGENVRQILEKLGTALNPPGDEPVPIVGMTYYDPFNYLGLVGAQYSAGIARLNQVLLAAYADAGVPVARADLVFQTVDDTCRWTTYCKGFNYHPNTEGYGVIARTFYDVLGKH